MRLQKLQQEGFRFMWDIDKVRGTSPYVPWVIPFYHPNPTWTWIMPYNVPRHCWGGLLYIPAISVDWWVLAALYPVSLTGHHCIRTHEDKILSCMCGLMEEGQHENSFTLSCKGKQPIFSPNFMLHIWMDGLPKVKQVIIKIRKSGWGADIRRYTILQDPWVERLETVFQCHHQKTLLAL